VENISALVEELGIKNKAFYLPSSLSGNKPKAFIPLAADFEFNDKVLPRRLIVKYSSKPDSMGLLVITPGSAVGGMVEPKEDCLAGDIESAISAIVSGTINLADGIRVKLENDKILVEVRNLRLENKDMWVYSIIGSPIASIVASVVAEISNKPVQIISVCFSRNNCVIELKMVKRNLESAR
jgi:hypothetical protein